MRKSTGIAATLATMLVVISFATSAQADESSSVEFPYQVEGDDRRAELVTDRAAENTATAAAALFDEGESISDAALVAFLLVAKGPIAERNPDAVAVAEAQIPALKEVSDEQALEASQEYVDASDVFQSEIRPGLLSDNPVHVQNAIEAFGSDFLAYVDSLAPGVGEAAQGLASKPAGCNGTFCVKQTALVGTTAVVVWQVAGLHSAAAVTIALAAAVFVYLPGDERMSAVDQQIFTSDFMTSVRM
ncbi:hypothetical protein [Jonesia quinghaiensis]|uniref:hypothetical protein n=1 Tax=Jonesia quinghaiensis TaxID=262806 RepID=UPI0003FEBA12|nr:hypothetical protein [Jonesia quinghaiensis]